MLSVLDLLITTNKHFMISFLHFESDQINLTAIWNPATILTWIKVGRSNIPVGFFGGILGTSTPKLGAGLWSLYGKWKSMEWLNELLESRLFEYILSLSPASSWSLSTKPWLCFPDSNILLKWKDLDFCMPLWWWWKVRTIVDRTFFECQAVTFVFVKKTKEQVIGGRNVVGPEVKFDVFPLLDVLFPLEYCLINERNKNPFYKRVCQRMSAKKLKRKWKTWRCFIELWCLCLKQKITWLVWGQGK